MLILTGILSVGSEFMTTSSDLMSGLTNQTSSVPNMNNMKTTQQMLMIAPVVVGWVRSFGTFRYMSIRLMSNPISVSLVLKLVFLLKIYLFNFDIDPKSLENAIIRNISITGKL